MSMKKYRKYVCAGQNPEDIFYSAKFYTGCGYETIVNIDQFPWKCPKCRGKLDCTEILEI